MRVLLLEHKVTEEALRQALREVADWLLVVRLEEGLGGVWTEFVANQLVHHIGYPGNSAHSWFQVFRPRTGGETCASVHLSRIAFGQKIHHVVTDEACVLPVVSHALAGHDLTCWFAGRHCAAEDFLSLRSPEDRDRVGWSATVEALRECAAP